MNKIHCLQTASGDQLLDFNSIQNEILGFYKTLLGSSSPSLTAIHLPPVRRGPVLSSAARQLLSCPVSTTEISQALKSIDENFAPGLVFFKHIFNIIKAEVYEFLSNW